MNSVFFIVRISFGNSKENYTCSITLSDQKRFFSEHNEDTLQFIEEALVSLLEEDALLVYRLMLSNTK